MLHNIHRIILSSFLLLLLSKPALAQKDEFIIVVAAEGTEITSQISKVAARAPYFLFFDKQNNLLQAEANPYGNAAGRAGPKAAIFLAEKKINLIIAEQFGHKMLDALKHHTIETVERHGSVIDAVKEQNHEQ